MTEYRLPSSCQQKFAATSNCIQCGVWVDALVHLGDIAFCPQDRTCDHHDLCAREAARCAGDMAQGPAQKSRLLDRLRRILPRID
jgi:hypothetical protein